MLIRIWHYRVFILCFLMIFIFSSCTVERQLADGFVKKLPEIDIQLFTPDVVFKYNHKGEEIPHFDSLISTQQDSALFAHSRYIQFISDSLFLDKYVNGFIDELRALGFKVYLDNAIDSVLLTKPQAYLVNIAQIQLDEYLFPFEDSETILDTVFYKRVQLNGVDQSSWFELSKMNIPNPVKTVLYSEFSASDGFDGRFTVDPFTYDVRYKYKIDSLKVKDVYELATFSGRKNASYLFDYFMNQYINHHMPADEEPYDFFHYNRFRHTITSAGEERFEVLESK